MERSVLDPLPRLSPHDRSIRYRQMAAEAEANAKVTGNSDLQEGYRVLAEKWRDMAASIDAAHTETDRGQSGRFS
jgi:hypothetical protein